VFSNAGMEIQFSCFLTLNRDPTVYFCVVLQGKPQDSVIPQLEQSRGSGGACLSLSGPLCRMVRDQVSVCVAPAVCDFQPAPPDASSTSPCFWQSQKKKMFSYNGEGRRINGIAKYKKLRHYSQLPCFQR
jgi:hypothetical protein